MYSPERMACSVPKHRRDVTLEAPTIESVCLSSLMLSQSVSFRATKPMTIYKCPPLHLETLNVPYFLNCLGVYAEV